MSPHHGYTELSTSRIVSCCRRKIISSRGAVLEVFTDCLHSPRAVRPACPSGGGAVACMLSTTSWCRHRLARAGKNIRIQPPRRPSTTARKSWPINPRVCFFTTLARIKGRPIQSPTLYLLPQYWLIATHIQADLRLARQQKQNPTNPTSTSNSTHYPPHTLKAQGVATILGAATAAAAA